MSCHARRPAAYFFSAASGCLSCCSFSSARCRADLDSCPACPLLDLQLPGQSGLALQRQLGERLPIIVISGHGELNSAVEAMKAEATDFLPKPVSDSVLLDVLERTLEPARQTFEVRVELADIRAGSVICPRASARSLRSWWRAI